MSYLWWIRRSLDIDWIYYRCSCMYKVVSPQTWEDKSGKSVEHLLPYEFTSTTAGCGRGLNRRLFSPWSSVLPLSYPVIHDVSGYLRPAVLNLAIQLLIRMTVFTTNPLSCMNKEQYIGKTKLLLAVIYYQIRNIYAMHISYCTFGGI